jgi:uncharacterized membrane protein
MTHGVPSFNLLARCAGLGVVAGMRSQLPFALLAVAANRGDFAAGAGRPLSWLRSRRALAGLGLAAGGELIGDKLPKTPSRLEPVPLAGRLAIGGAAGAALARQGDWSLGLGAGLGSAGAALGAYAGYHLRALAGQKTGLPDPVWAVVEDVVAVALGASAVGLREG